MKGNSRYSSMNRRIRYSGTYFSFHPHHASHLHFSHLNTSNRKRKKEKLFHTQSPILDSPENAADE